MGGLECSTCFFFSQNGVVLVDNLFCPALDFNRSFSLELKDCMSLMVKPHFMLIFINLIELKLKSNHAIRLILMLYLKP